LRVLSAARQMTLLLTLLLPSLLFDFSSNQLAADASAFQIRPAAAFLPHHPAHRFLWLVFDELDQGIAFERRPVSVHLPELDRLRAQSFTASNSTQAG